MSAFSESRHPSAGEGGEEIEANEGADGERRREDAEIIPRLLGIKRAIQAFAALLILGFAFVVLDYFDTRHSVPAAPDATENRTPLHDRLADRQTQAPIIPKTAPEEMSTAEKTFGLSFSNMTDDLRSRYKIKDSVTAPVGAGTSPSGSRTARRNFRVETLISIRFIAHLPSQSSATPPSQFGSASSWPVRSRRRQPTGLCRHHGSAVDVPSAYDRCGSGRRSRRTLRRGSRPQRQHGDDDTANADRSGKEAAQLILRLVEGRDRPEK